jgi:hypothetical protein
LKLLLGVTLLAVALQTVLLGTAIVSGRAAALPQASGWFQDAQGRPCQKPCLFGVVIGQTTFDAAMTALRHHPSIESLTLIGRSNTVEKFLTSRYFDLFLKLDADQRVVQMDLTYLQLPETESQFGAVLQSIGTPDLILGFYDSVTLFSLQSGVRLDVKITGCRVKPASRIYQLEVVADLKALIDRMALLQPWSGFASTLVYQAQFRNLHPDLYGYWMHRCVD